MTLVSNSSTAIFPENKTSSFTVLLPEKISLRGQWRVAVAEIHYNYNFFNVTDGNNKIILKRNEIDDNSISKNCDVGTGEVTIQTGFYRSVGDLIATINFELLTHVKGPILSLNKVSNRTIVHRENVSDNIESIQFEGRLGMQLGFEPMRNILNFKTSPHVGNTFFGIPDQMMIYTDIIEPTFVGHEKAYVLKIINTEPKNYQFGDACYKEYTHMHYIPVQKREFESISVDIRDYTGQLIPFQHGILTIKLHFKKQDEEKKY